MTRQPYVFHVEPFNSRGIPDRPSRAGFVNDVRAEQYAHRLLREDAAYVIITNPDGTTTRID